MKTTNVSSRRLKIKPDDHRNLKRLRKTQTPLRQRFIEDLQFHQFCDKTCEKYLDQLLRLTAHYWKSPANLSDEDLRCYFNYLQNGCQYSPSSMGITHAALTFFYNFTCMRDMPFLRIYRNRKAPRIPHVLSQQQVFAALDKVRNERYRACMLLMYSCGLRAGEAVKLKCSDINKQTSLLHVRRGKGDKDRFIPVPERTLQILREMWRNHHHPELLFPAYYVNTRLPQKHYGVKNKPFSAGVIATHFKAALRASGYKGKATVHTLRHSYATHMLEAGVPLFTVKSYLGHKCLSSTMVYLHCTEKMRRDSAGAVDGLTQNFPPPIN